MTRPGIEQRSPGSLANTLLIRQMARLSVNTHNKKHRSIADSIIMSYHNTIKQRPGVFNLFSHFVKLVLKCYKNLNYISLIILNLNSL